ncbi:MAG TPA: hypothetical protein VNN10_13725 [Dehalococcoidia bacterium]|nr:hypothetical protein [Dehalococcoidia bacterium]
MSDLQTYDLPIDPQIVSQLAQGTIKGLLDAVVELMTNSDDSYRRLEENGQPGSGRISLTIRREKGGICRFLEVSDEAEGMDWSKLHDAIKFAASTSGILQGQSVRGLFGRGLKEAIVALGRGRIRTTRGGRESIVDIFVEEGRPRCREVAIEQFTGAATGTTVSIEVLSDKVKCPAFDTLERQISTHFALRDILSRPDRTVRLRLEDGATARSKDLAFSPLEGNLRVDLTKHLDGLGEVSIKVYESKERLYFKPSDPGSLAGLVVKTEGTNLDNRLFGYEGEDAAQYFFGTVDCPGIAQLLRMKEFGILNPNRNGLDWRHHLCQRLERELSAILRELVEAKRRELQGERRIDTRERYRTKVQELCKLLNELAEQELEDLPAWAINRALHVETLAVRPAVANTEPGLPRTFTVYASQVLLDKHGPVCWISLADCKGVQLSTPEIELRTHPKYEGLFYGTFEAQGSNYGDYGVIEVELGPATDFAELRVSQKVRPTKRTHLQGSRRGVFRDIVFDETVNPTQRVSLMDGTINVYVDFPATKRYLRSGGEGMETSHGSLMLAELMAEAFCKYVARQRMESGQVLTVTGGEVDAFNAEVNSLMRRHLDAIHRAVVVWS